MNAIFGAVLATILAIAVGASVPEIHTDDRQAEDWRSDYALLRDVPAPYLTQLRALRQRVISDGCPVNLCFAIQGDKFINNKQFQLQKDFIEVVLAITTTDDSGNFCAVQYGRTTTAISPLTSSKTKFLNAVQDAEKVGGEATNVAAALSYTGFQVRTRGNDPRKVVLLGDGVQTVGGAPERVGKRMLNEGTNICAVAIGRAKNFDALNIITGSAERVVRIGGFFELGEIVIAIVEDVCGY